MGRRKVQEVRTLRATLEVPVKVAFWADFAFARTATDGKLEWMEDMEMDAILSLAIIVIFPTLVNCGMMVKVKKHLSFPSYQLMDALL